MERQILGVIGGLGPIATAHFMELVIAMTDAKTDQENMDMIVYNFPSIPDRTGYILGSNLKSPLPGLRSVGQALARQRVSCIAIPCVTAHYFHKELQSVIPVPILNGVAETVNLLKEKGIRKVGLMATDGTIRSQLLSKELDYAGIVPVIPSEKRQEDVMHLIYENIKAGKPAERNRFRRVQQELMDCGAEIIILGCTELSIIKRDEAVGAGFIDVMEVLAREAVLRCGKKLRPAYEDLIKGGDIHAKKHSGISGKNRGPGTGQNRVFLRK